MGESCEIEKCPNNCSKHGDCVNGFCQCYEFFKGKCFQLKIVFTCIALAKAGLVVGPLRSSVCPSVRSTFGVPSLCNL